MNDSVQRKIIIVGGGTSGWMTAALMARLLDQDKFSICLIESEQLGTVGVGEATIPPIREFNYLLGIDEAEFLKETSATYKLGIKFEGWGTAQSSYLHSFGVHGRKLDDISFHHYWLKARQYSQTTPPFDGFALPGRMAKNNVFCYPEHNNSNLHTHSYAYHFDAVRYAFFLRRWSEGKGVIRQEGQVEQVILDAEDGSISQLRMADGSEYAADLFIDCSGFKSLLLGEALGVGYEDWSQWLPCNKALAMRTSLECAPAPYTLSSAKSAGWQWKIPLQTRMGNGLVYASDFISDERAEHHFTADCSGAPEASIRAFNFTAGRRKKSWEKNCIAIGLSSGFLEPLESTSIYLIQAAIYKLMELFPLDGHADIERDEFNRGMATEYERIRDFLILHYKLNRREDSDFWRYCANMSVPDSLQHKMALFRDTGAIIEYDEGSFAEPSWLAVYLGQGYYPNNVHPLIERYSIKQLDSVLFDMTSELDACMSNASNPQEMLAKVISGEKIISRQPVTGMYGS